MKKFFFSVTIEIRDDSEEEAISKVQTYCNMANLYAEKFDEMKMRFLLHGLEGDEDCHEEDTELTIFDLKNRNLKNLN